MAVGKCKGGFGDRKITIQDPLGCIRCPLSLGGTQGQSSCSPLFKARTKSCSPQQGRAPAACSRKDSGFDHRFPFFIQEILPETPPFQAICRISFSSPLLCKITQSTKSFPALILRYAGGLLRPRSSRRETDVQQIISAVVQRLPARSLDARAHK